MTIDAETIQWAINRLESRPKMKLAARQLRQDLMHLNMKGTAGQKNLANNIKTQGNGNIRSAILMAALLVIWSLLLVGWS